ncbi:MAG: 50S ribosomal protein L25/general stress protein Ctc [Bifidobacteriaceae bacterium]|nr:50S ribosomal protein L25/general stress protein Ctc [Bifidobacteriaceae bacterium]
MADATLNAETRIEFGKGAARRTRRAGLVPAVIHDRGADPVHISLPAHATGLALRHANALLEIVLGGNTVLALTREVQRHPFRDYIEHVDLQAVKLGEKIEVEVPVHIDGEPLVGIAILDTQNLRVQAEATNIPEAIVVNVDGLGDGEVIRASQLTLPDGASLVGDDDHIVVSISIPRGEIDIEPTEEAAAPESTDPTVS